MDMQLASRFQLLSKGGQFEGNMNPVSYMGEDTKTSTISTPSLDLMWCVSFVTNLVTMPRNTIKIENILLKHHKPIIPNHMVDSMLKTSRSTRASYYITFDLNNIVIHFEYNGNDDIIIGNGANLPIFHIGSMIHLTNHKFFFT